jgi:hypothetical protein
MITVTCDECHEPIDRDESRWFGVDYTAPLDVHPDPVQAMNDAEAEMVATLKVGFGGDHEFHSHEGDPA